MMKPHADRPPTALVLGASGFIGGHIARALLEEGWGVRGLRRSPYSVGHLGDLRIDWLEGDVEEPARLRLAMEGADVLFHAAGYVPPNTYRIPAKVAQAVQRIRGVLQAAKAAGIRRVVYTSSLSTIGTPPPGAHRLADERDAYIPWTAHGSAYYECKYAMESEVMRAAARGLDAVVVNPTLVLGPGDVHLSVSGILVAAAKGYLRFWLPGEINVVDVRDVAWAQVRAAEAGRQGERYVLGGHNVSVRDLIERICETAGAPPPLVGMPRGLLSVLAWLLHAIPPLDRANNHLRAADHWQAIQTTKARDELGLNPRPLESTLQDALAWLEKQGKLKLRRSLV